VFKGNDAAVQKLCVGATCVTPAQLQAMVAAASAPSPTGSGAPATPPSGDASTTLTLTGNDPVDWQAGTPWQDNLGALFTHDGQSETIYSTSTVDTSAVGTTTIDYWAQVPGANLLHATRAVVVNGAANDNSPPATNNAATTSAATSTGTQ